MKPMHAFKWTVCALLIMLVAGMSGREHRPSPPIPDTRETIRILAAQTSENADDAPKVVDAINAMGFAYRVEILFVPFQYYQQTLHQYLTTGEQLDIIYGTNSGLFELYSQDKLFALNSLLSEYGQGILNAVKPEYFKVGRTQGEQYALPINRDFASSYGFEYRVDLAEQYGLDFESVRTLDDLEAVFEQLTAQTDEIIPLVYYNGKDWDSLGDNLGVLMDRGAGGKIVNLYATQQYRDYVERIYRWRQNGWVMDTVSMSMNNTDYLRSGRVLGSLSTTKPGFDIQETRSVGAPVRSVELVAPYVTTDQVGRAMWAVTKNSPSPELAMDFLNRMYTDPDLYNLLTFGIEGEHYVFVDREHKVIDYPPGVDAQNSGYAQFLGWMYGNQYLSYIWNGNEVDIWDKTRVYNDSADRSRAMGFVFDTTPVGDIWMNCRNIQNRYADALEQGYLNPAVYLDQLNRELQSVGLETVLTEKQRQFDAWLGEQE